ncbi:TPA: Flp pilus assembly complex ATPase component TadA [Candidatus Micrarchaeota archaeon]|nr:Flp pilus assembly complex ATPase component TadA [Candidatus Micrarchaeota archaeon]
MVLTPLLDKKKCNECGACLNACPKKPSSLKIFACVHCPPEFRECNECIWGATPECDGCPHEERLPCVAACSRKALFSEEDAVGWRFAPFPAFSSEAVIAVSPESVPHSVENGRYYVHFPYGMQPSELRVYNFITKEFQEQARDEKNLRAEKRETVRKKISQLIKEFCEERGLLLEKKRAHAIGETCVLNACGYGGLDYLLADDSLEEISVIGINKPVFVFERGRSWLRTNLYLTTEEFAIAAVNKMARSLGRRITFQTPRLNATLPDGSRLHATISPITINGVELTIRKFGNEPILVTDMLRSKTISAEAAAFLWTALFTDISMLIAGNTGSGKTTTLNALFSFVPLSDRVVVTEETPEITLPQKHTIRIVANEELGIQMKDLVKDTLRMRPDRVIIGEVRSSEETAALFDSLLSGQARGSYATFHADSSVQALVRLGALGARKEDLSAINLILVQRRIPVAENNSLKEVRRVTEITEVTQDGELGVLFSYSPRKDRLEKTKYFTNCRLLERICGNYRCTKEELEKRLSAKTTFLEKLVSKKPTQSQLINSVSSFKVNAVKNR